MTDATAKGVGRGGPGEPEELRDENHVVLRGRLAAEPLAFDLPSGDPLVTVRLVVRRPATRSPRPGAPTVDTLECSAWRPGVRRVVSSWAAGDVVEVAGSLRRRFWRGPNGAQSRWEVEVAKARRLSRSTTTVRSGGKSA